MEVAESVVTMDTFDFAIAYVLENEGVDSDHPSDRGGRTRYGITSATAARHGFDVDTLTLEQVKRIYRKDYWRFDGIRDARVAAKLLDIVVNCGVRGGIRIIQRAVGVTDDGVWGMLTSSAVQRLPSEQAIERLSIALADHYIDIVKRDTTQLAFFRGWIRRAIRRPEVKTA